jgi:hypothetical protein
MTERNWAYVHDTTMVDGLKSVLNFFDRPKRQGEYIRSLETSAVNRTLIQGIIDYLSEDLSCDHSVNICCCADAAVVEELQRALRGETQCPDCGGEGYTYSQELYDKRRAELLAMWGGEQWYDIGDHEGFVDCVRCNKSGVVKSVTA